MRNQRALGTEKESKAAAYLEEQGIHIIERNFRSCFGEIDLIGVEGKTLVFVEVKYRRNHGSGYPEEAVDRRKQIRICKTADFYRLRHRIYDFVPCRFDVVSIDGACIRHYKNAFDYEW